jgi:hypothetical protein
MELLVVAVALKEGGPYWMLYMSLLQTVAGGPVGGGNFCSLMYSLTDLLLCMLDVLLL